MTAYVVYGAILGAFVGLLVGLMGQSSIRVADPSSTAVGPPLLGMVIGAILGGLIVAVLQGSPANTPEPPTPPPTSARATLAPLPTHKVAAATAQPHCIGYDQCHRLYPSLYP